MAHQPTAVVALMLLHVAAAAWPGSGTNYCVLPSTLSVRPQDTCSDFGLFGASQSANISMQIGEVEAFQIVLRNDEELIGNVSVSSPDLKSGPHRLSRSSVTAFQVGYVFCNQSPRYEGSGGGWRPDPLLDIPATGVTVPISTAQSLWISVAAPRDVHPGVYTGTAAVVFTTKAGKQTISVSLSVTVWNITLPTLRESTIGTMWSGSWAPDYFKQYYGDAWNKTAYYDMMIAHRTPPDSIYISSPRPIDDYVYMAANGVSWFSLMDVCSLPLFENETMAYPARPGSYLAVNDCPSYSDDYVRRLLAILDPIVTQLQQRDLLQYAYVYGFDENPISCEPQVRKLFGAVKKAYPGLRTVATLNWSPMPVDLPVDVWVLQYEEYNAADAARWIAAGKRQFWYHCIEPSGLADLNTFIERPLIEDRLLFWLAAAGAGVPSGWLYYATDLWIAGSGLSHTVLKRLNGTQPFTDFNPGNYVWLPEYTDIFANGDGQYIYPGVNGPISTVRLEAIRDGLEDWELFARLSKEQLPMLSAIVRSPTDWTGDPALLESLRRQAAGKIAA